jgi:HAD superfamily hydrolase (TIGR01450 family)
MDLDGVVYRGAEAVPGAAELIETLRAAGIRVRYATNNSMATRAQYAERLAGHGIPALADEIVTSTSATISFLRRRLPEVHRVLGAGAPALSSELRAEGFDETSAAELARPDYQGEPLGSTFDAVIVGLDQASTYGRVAVAATAIRQGARLIATNADLRYPTARGFLPGAGSLVAAIRAAAGDVEPIVIGKPGTAMFTGILADAGVAAEDAVVVGDNPDSDIIAARRAGIFAILVLTGVADAVTARGLEGERRPDLVVADPWELRERFVEWLS